MLQSKTKWLFIHVDSVAMDDILIDIVALTEDLSTLEAEFAHLTSANSRINSCLVLAEKL